MVKVAIAHSPKIEDAITAALEQVAVEPLVRGKVVAIHPNDTWASAEDKTAITQPDSLQAVLRYVKRFSPKELNVSEGSGITIASTDPVAADTVGAQLLGFQAQAVRHIWEAARLGSGEAELEKIEFSGLDMKKAFSLFTKAAYGRSIEFEHP
jgi:uncharacterized protein (DUF362 family)